MRVYGKNVSEEVIKNESIKKAYVSKNFNNKKIINLLREKKVSIRFTEKNILDKMIKENHQGIILDVDEFEYTPLDELGDVIIMLDHLEDPHNFGAIIRTAEASGFNSIIIPKDRSVDVNPTVFKVSTGAVENVKISRVNNLVNTIKDLKKKGYWIIGTDMKGTDYKKIDYSEKIVIVIGSEGKGMTRLVRENCDFIASIPMRGKVNSLNASVSAGIIIFEAVNRHV